MGVLLRGIIGPYYVITENLNSQKYIDDILNSFYSKFFEENIGKNRSLIFQQNDAPYHT